MVVLGNFKYYSGSEALSPEELSSDKHRLASPISYLGRCGMVPYTKMPQASLSAHNKARSGADVGEP